MGLGEVLNNLQSNKCSHCCSRRARSCDGAATGQMGKRGKERKRKRAGLTPEPGADAEIDADDPLGGLSEGDVETTIRSSQHSWWARFD